VLGLDGPLSDEVSTEAPVSLARSFSKLFLRLNGWQAEGRKPTARRYVLIAAPHTSNWDLAYLLALAGVYGIRVQWMGKDTLFRGPMGWAMRKLGGIPVRRDRSSDLVSQMAEVLDASQAMALTVPAEGTRDYVSNWKSGFYHIARTAGVPIVMGYLDYGRKRGGFGPELIPTGSIRDDMDEIRAFYSDKQARHPDKSGEIRLKEEM
jgi:1-acyl-sn-glycerol-3-phosphate acyltransferase